MIRGNTSGSLRPWVEPSEIRAVLLDAGNTLVFLDFDAIADAIEASGFPIETAALEPSEYRARRRVDQKYLEGGFTDASMWQCYFDWLMEEAGVPSGLRPEILERLRQRHAESNLWSRTRPEVSKAMAKLKDSGRIVAVISNSDGSCRELLRRLELLSFCHAVYDSAELGVEKPDERIFEIALRDLTVEPTQALYMGDLEAIDVLGARLAGILPVLADPHPRGNAVDFPVLRGVHELPDALEIER
jgi:putative hydrolase of the HAD superfamily